MDGTGAVAGSKETTTSHPLGVVLEDEVDLKLTCRCRGWG